jgi:hypothetical protein
MVNKQKVKGTQFELKIVSDLNEKVKNSKWRRIPGSGALGTTLGEASLCGDLKGEITSFPKTFRAEAKTGYNNSTGKAVKQFTLKKEWLDKIKMEAGNSYSLPFLVGHFGNARSGIKDFIVLDIEDFIYILNYCSELHEELEKAYEK